MSPAFPPPQDTSPTVLIHDSSTPDNLDNTVLDDNLPPLRGPEKQVVPPAPAARKGLFLWILVPLLVLGVGFTGFRLGKTGSAPSGAGQSTTANDPATGNANSQNAAGQSSIKPAPAPKVIPVQMSTAKSGTLRTERRLTGNVVAAQTVTVTSQASGTVNTILKNVGDSVGAGQTVLQLSNRNLATGVQSAQNNLQTAQAQLEAQQSQLNANTSSLEQAITTAQAALATAQASYASLEKLYQVGAIARAALDAQGIQVQASRTNLLNAQSNLATNKRTTSASLTAAQLNVQKAQIAVRQAQDAAADVNVSAPFAGQITAMSATSGQYLNANTAAFTLSSHLQQVKVSVPATEAVSLPVGAELNFIVGTQKYPLKVIQNPGGSSDSVPITAKFTAGGVPQGTVGSVVYTAKVATGVLVPSTALQVGDSTTYVYTVEGGKAKQRLVTVLGQAASQSVVSGISAGAAVVSQPPTSLLDGSRVVINASSSTGSTNPAGSGSAASSLP